MVEVTTFHAPFPHEFTARTLLCEELICVTDFMEGAIPGVSGKRYDGAVTQTKFVSVNGVGVPFIHATTALRILAESSFEGLRARKSKAAAIAAFFWGQASEAMMDHSFVKFSDTLIVLPPPAGYLVQCPPPMAGLDPLDCLLMETMLMKTAKDCKIVSSRKDGKLIVSAITSAVKSHFPEGGVELDELYTFFFRLVAHAMERKKLAGPLDVVVEEIKRRIGDAAVSMKRSKYPVSDACFWTEWVKTVSQFAHAVATGMSVADFREIQTSLCADEEPVIAYTFLARRCVDIVSTVFYASLSALGDDDERADPIYNAWFSLIKWSGLHETSLLVLSRTDIDKNIDELSRLRKRYLEIQADKKTSDSVPELMSDTDQSSQGSTEF
eukprot:jgi/Mesvir1/1517/Mv14500-RA.1